MRATFAVLAAATAVVNAKALSSYAPDSIPADKLFVISATSNDNGAPVILADRSTDIAANNQVEFLFAYKGVPTGTTFTFFNGAKCLDLTDGIRADGTKVQIWDCAGNSNQQWTTRADGTVELTGSGLCLDVTDGNYSTGNHLQVWTCDFVNQKNQHWREQWN